MPIDSETDVEKVEIVRDEQDNVQRPANTAEQQATQDAIDAAKNELLTKLDTVGADPIEKRGTPVEVRLSNGEQVTVPDGVAWVVTLHLGNNSTSGSEIHYVPSGMDPEFNERNLTAATADKGWSNGSPTTILHAGGIVGVSGDTSHILGWEVPV